MRQAGSGAKFQLSFTALGREVERALIRELFAKSNTKGRIKLAGCWG